MNEEKIIKWIETLPKNIKDKLKSDLLIYGDAYIHLSMKVINPLNITLKYKDNEEI